MNAQEKPILLIEDDKVDIVITKRLLKDSGVFNPVVSVLEGEEGLRYLQEHKSLLPCLVFLDLNLPRMDGWKVLETIKSDEVLRHIPVAIVTGSNEDEDKSRGQALGVVDYIVKDSNKDTFGGLLVQALETSGAV